MVTQCQARLIELKATGQLPSPTGVALAIMRLTRNEGVKVTQLAQTLESDPAMVGRMLKLANSALAGSARPVTTVQEAITRLGLRAVRNLALGFSLIRRTGSAASRDGLVIRPTPTQRPRQRCDALEKALERPVPVGYP